MKTFKRLSCIIIFGIFLIILFIGTEYLNRIKSPSSSFSKIVLISVLTTPEKLERRSLIRASYARLSSSLADLKFVFCIPKSPEMEILVKLEKSMYKDIIVLNCTENMDEGKTYSYFSSIPKLYESGTYDYVMKTDDDVFLHIPNLVRKLQKLPKEGLFYGRSDNYGFMTGMGYVISWDFCHWISTNEYANQNRIGQEDALVAKWYKKSGLLKNWISDKDQVFYDAPEFKNGWAHEYRNETILIHRLKDTLWFLHAVEYFMKHELEQQDLLGK